MPKKGSTKIKSSPNQNGQPKTKKRRSSAAAQQQQQNIQNQMQQMQNNNYSMMSNNPFDDYSNQQPPPNNQQQMHNQMNGSPGSRLTPQQRLPPNNMQSLTSNQQMHNSYPMSNGMMQQGPSGNYGLPNGGQMIMQQMNGPMSNYHQSMMQNQQQINLPSSNPQMKIMSNTFGKTYPAGQPILSNPANPNAPPIFLCKVCQREVHENEQSIICDAGCNFFHHRQCTNLTDAAFNFLKNEVFAEWVCDTCEKTKNIPLVKYKS